MEPAPATYLLVLTGVSSTYYKNVYIKIVYNYFVNIKLKVEYIIFRVLRSEFWVWQWTRTFIPYTFNILIHFVSFSGQIFHLP